MTPFKFLQKNITITSGNFYIGFNMDMALVNVLRYKQIHNLDIINSSDINLQNVGLPISDCWLRILTWRSYPYLQPERIEIDYRIFVTNTTPINFTASMETEELLRLIKHDEI